MSEETKKYKRATVKIPIIHPSQFEIKLKRDNERLVRHLERLERGPFGLKKWFNN